MLKAWYEEGYSLRHIMTEALLRLDEHRSDQAENNVLEEVNGKLDSINRLLEWIGNTQPNDLNKQKEISSSSKLPDSFIVSIKKITKPGLKIE